MYLGNQFASTLRELKLEGIICQPRHIDGHIRAEMILKSINHLPSTLTRLHLSTWWFNIPLDNLPESLTHLTLEHGHVFNFSLDHLPASLKHLSLSDDFDKPIDFLPCSLDHLEIGPHFGLKIDYLPPLLKRLHLKANLSPSKANR